MPEVDGKNWSATDPTWHPGTLRKVWNDLEENELGTQKGEQFDVPSNYRIPTCRVYVINHSRTQPWKRIKVAVSEQRGAEDALVADKELAKIYNVDTLIQRVAKGIDMNRYETSVKPVVFAFTLSGKQYIIPPAKTKDEEPPRIEVPEGAWDLFLGNYDRMRSKDPEQKGSERVWISKRWKLRANPVFQFRVDGDLTPYSSKGKEANAFGFIELMRETQHVGEIPMDREYLRAMEIVEV